MTRANKPPNHLILKFLKELYVDGDELRDIGYSKDFILNALIQYCPGHVPIWRDFTSYVRSIQAKIKRYIANGIIMNPVSLRSNYEEDRRYWRDIAVPLLVANDLIYIRFDDTEWRAMAKLEYLSYIGSKKIKQHFVLAREECLHMADIGAKIRGDGQAKMFLREIQDLDKLAFKIKPEREEKPEDAIHALNREMQHKNKQQEGGFN